MNSDHGVGRIWWCNEQLIDQADSLYDTVRVMCYDTVNQPVIPALALYPILGNLYAAPWAQLCRQLGVGLIASAEHYQLIEYDDPGRDPETSIAIAVEHLRHAAHAADQFSRHLCATQTAIAGQGIRHSPSRGAQCDDIQTDEG